MQNESKIIQIMTVLLTNITIKPKSSSILDLIAKFDDNFTISACLNTTHFSILVNVNG